MPTPVVRHGFAQFLHRRSLRRLFRRPHIFEAATPIAVRPQLPDSLADNLRQSAQHTPEALLRALGSRPNGLNLSEAAAMRARVGNNTVAHEEAIGVAKHLWLCYRNPFNILLTALAAISHFTHDARATVMIGTMVLLSVGMRFYQERRSHHAADALKALVTNTATVLRPIASGNTDDAASCAFPSLPQETPLVQVVPGDVVRLSAGDMLPADVRFLSTKDLFVNQAAMTGESLPVAKQSDTLTVASGNPLTLENMGFMGTNVVSGSATAVVVATGAHTYFGTLAKHASAAPQTETAFQQGVNQVSWLLIRFMLVMVPLVFLMNGLRKHDWLEALLFALSVAVGLTPEMLPAIVTATLAKGAVFLSRKKVIVKSLEAMQNLGAMDVLCTDKTGTLTQDKVCLKRHLDAFGKASDAVLEAAYLNSHYQTGLKNLLDVAVLQHAELHLRLGVTHNFRKVDEVPFDFTRRRMSVVVAKADQTHLLICKGAVDEVMAVCTHVQQGETAVPLTPALMTQLREVTASLNHDGMRVVAVASKVQPAQARAYGVADECGLTLLGHMAFLDPPKESTSPALKALRSHGIQVKILTGDNDLVTRKVCREVGLPVSRIIIGEDIDKLDDAALAELVETCAVFARLTPLHKERIVRSLRSNGHVVGFMGDGINDAAALHAADLGISVDTAVDIAKEAADIILLEKSLMVLNEGVREGRKTFANMLKYIKMTASSNFGNVCSVVLACALLPFLPMLPIQLLVQNLLYDFSQFAIPLDHVDKEFLQQPQRWNPQAISRFMFSFGPISTLFDIATFAVLWWVFDAHHGAQQSLFQSGWFVEGLMSQTLIVHLIRTRKIPFLESRASGWLMFSTVVVMSLAVALPMSGLAASFHFVALPVAYFAWLAVLMLLYMILVQAMKGWYAQRFGW